VDIADIMQATKAPGHRVFAGKLVKKQLSFPDRAMAAALPVPKAISGTGRRSRPGRQRSPMPSGRILTGLGRQQPCYQPARTRLPPVVTTA
jgi:hypothetical protein